MSRSVVGNVAPVHKEKVGQGFYFHITLYPLKDCDDAFPTGNSSQENLFFVIL